MYGCENSGFLEMCTKQPTKRETCDQHPIKIECVPCYMRCGYEYVQSRACMGWKTVIVVCVYVCVCMGLSTVILVCVYVCMGLSTVILVCVYVCVYGFEYIVRVKFIKVDRTEVPE